LAVPGTRAIVHETPQQRTSWAPHGIDAYYVGPSLEHYRCYKFFIPITNSTRNATTVDWFPTTIKYPQVTTETYLQPTAEDLLHILQRTHNPTTTLNFGSPIINAYIQIANILQRAISPLHTNTKSTTTPQTTGIQQRHLAKETRVIDNAPQRHLTKETRVIDNAPNATSATASNTSPIVSPNKQPASWHTTDNMFETAAEATSGASSKQHQIRTVTFHNANSIINQHKHQQATTTPPLKGRADSLTKLLQSPENTPGDAASRTSSHAYCRTRNQHQTTSSERAQLYQSKNNPYHATEKSPTQTSFATTVHKKRKHTASA